MSINKPFFFAPDILSNSFDFETIFFLSFEKLFNKEFLSEINDDSITQVQYKLTQYSEVINSKLSSEKITCIFTENGAYWLDEEMLNTLILKLENSNRGMELNGNDPLWKLTSREILAYHHKNIRHIVQSVANDAVLLENLKHHMNGEYKKSKINIDNNRKIVNKLLSNINDQEIYCDNFIKEEFSLIERCRITRTMIENGYIDVKTLGYGIEDLVKVEELLQNRCDYNNPEINKAFLKNLINDLLECERLQLKRIVQWEELMESIELDALGYDGLTQIFSVMRKSLEFFINNREKEIDQCSYFKDVMSDKIKIMEDIHKDGEALTDNEIEQLLNRFDSDTELNQSGSPQQKGSSNSNRIGMAFRNRRR